MVLGALSVGAPHHRKRWYCVAIAPALIGTTLSRTRGVIPRYDWSKRAEPPRTAPVKSADWDARMKCLGMAVVPDAVAVAFAFLLTFNPKTVFEMTSASYRYNIGDACGDAIRRQTPFLPAAVLTSMGMLRGLPSLVTDVRDFKLVFDPKAYTHSNAPSAITSRLLTSPISSSHWATPRYAFIRPPHHATARNIQTLTAQIRFEVRTIERSDAASLRFVEWLMGYHAEWTMP